MAWKSKSDFIGGLGKKEGVKDEEDKGIYSDWLSLRGRELPM